MSKTKKRIIEATISLFNEHGFANVSLPHIAEKLSISLGNLTYHFRKKDQLIDSIYALFQEELAAITKDYEFLMDLEEMDKRLRVFYEFQQRFQFFYLDLLEIERAYPKIAKKHQAHIEGQINGLYKSFSYNESLGYLVKQDSPKIYKHLAKQFWLSTVFWLMQLAVRGKEGTMEEMTTNAWLLVLPHTTKEGKLQFKDIFNLEKIA